MLPCIKLKYDTNMHGITKKNMMTVKRLTIFVAVSNWPDLIRVVVSLVPSLLARDASFSKLGMNNGPTILKPTLNMICEYLGI